MTSRTTGNSTGSGSPKLGRREPAPDPPRPLRPAGPRARARARRVVAGRRLGGPPGARRCDRQGHVAIDSTGMLMDATGEPVTAAGDTFVVHMDREALNDYPLGRYDVTVTITTLIPDREIAWTVKGRIRPQVGHVYGYRLEPAGDAGTLVTSYYDWSSIHPHWREAGIFPVVSEAALRATLGILARTVARGYIGRRT